jgi:hypothetical protein
MSSPAGIAAQNRTNHDIGGKFDLSKPDLSIYIIYSKWQCFCQCGTKVHTIANHILTGIRRVQRFLTPKLSGRDKTQHLHVCGGISISASLFSSPKGSSSIWVISTIGPFSTKGQKTKTQAKQNKGNNKKCSFLCAFFWEYKIHIDTCNICMYDILNPLSGCIYIVAGLGWTMLNIWSEDVRSERCYVPPSQTWKHKLSHKSFTSLGLSQLVEHRRCMR